MLFYFTATGNSLYAAKHLEENPISIPQIIDQPDLNFEDERIGIVAPVYGHEVPEMVKAFMKKARFHTNYFYMILTYGNRHGVLPSWLMNYARSAALRSIILTF